MDSLEDLKKKKLEELQAQMHSNQDAEMQEMAKLQNELAQLESFAKQHMTKDAMIRYGNIKLASPEKATSILVMLAQLFSSGQVSTIDDNLLKQIILRVTPKKRDIKITRK